MLERIGSPMSLHNPGPAPNMGPVGLCPVQFDATGWPYLAAGLPGNLKVFLAGNQCYRGESEFLLAHNLLSVDTLCEIGYFRMFRERLRCGVAMMIDSANVLSGGFSAEHFFDSDGQFADRGRLSGVTFPMASWYRRVLYHSTNRAISDSSSCGNCQTCNSTCSFMER
jgi:hypothetical protein